MCRVTKLTVTSGERPQFEEALADGRRVTLNCGGETPSCSTRRGPAEGLSKNLTTNAAGALNSLIEDVALIFFFWNKMVNLPQFDHDLAHCAAEINSSEAPSPVFRLHSCCNFMCRHSKVSIDTGPQVVP